MSEYDKIQSMPRAEDVTTIPAGDHTINVVTVTPENADYLVQVALSMYTNEPCRICGAMLTLDDVNNGAVYAGYSQDSAARAAHKSCWQRSPGRNGATRGVVHPNSDWARQ